MAAQGMGKTHRPMSEINVTPFVDVMLVLLIIFMVTAPMMEQGLEVDLPNTNTENIRVKDQPLVITVKRDGKIHLAESGAFELDELEGKLDAILDADATREVFLRADERVPYGVVAKVMARARAAGVEKLGMVTEPE
jgi:biopolymer transport protein TolR